MKKIRFVLLTPMVLALTACPFSKSDAVDSIINGGGGGGNSESNFNLTIDDTGHSVVKELSEKSGGVSISFAVTTYVDGELTSRGDATLSRVNEIEWGTFVHQFKQDDQDVTKEFAGAIKLTEEEAIAEVYYQDQETKEYVYYGDVYNPAISYTFEDLENYLTLDNAYLAALVAFGDNGNIEVISGQTCLTFTLTHDTCSYVPSGDVITVSFGLNSHLLMKAHHTHYEYDAENVPTVYQENLDVSNFAVAGEVPNLVKPEA